MKNSVREKIPCQKIGSKNSKLKNQRREIGSREKILGRKVSVKNFCRKMEKIGLVCEKILGSKIGVKNSSWKMDEKKLVYAVKKFEVRK